MSILLVGAGPMAIEYARVLKAMNYPFITVGRSEKSAKNFEAATKTKAFVGGVEKWITTQNKIPKIAIVAVSEKNLGATARLLMERGIKTILVEKPGGYDAKDIERVGLSADKNNARAYVAYNRRFYGSVKKALQIIKKDGGVLSFYFDFTEWGHKIQNKKKLSGGTREWFLNNSTHVIDLAFYLCGAPKKITCHTARGISWHPNASIYTGAGVCQNGALFSYHANWESAGRWGLEVITPKHRLIFRPLEKLQIQDIGSVDIKEVPIDDLLDTAYKPGLYREVESFFGDKINLLTIGEQVKMLSWYKKMNTKK